jgi:hypothetical protein
VKINKLIVILAAVLFFASLTVGKADMTLWVDVRDSGGSSIAGTTVPVGTLVYAYGYYNNSPGIDASATITVFYSVDNTSFAEKATLFSGTVVPGQTVVGSAFALTDIGYYQFRWTCTEILDSSRCDNGVKQARVVLNNAVPEPAPLVSAVLGVLALGVFFVRKRNVKPVRSS